MWYRTYFGFEAVSYTLDEKDYKSKLIRMAKIMKNLIVTGN